ncbi:MAG: hypothetical protein ITF99_02810 [Chryseobacterium sp.]|nr:hypothetical protein [Chryseobacterium sp.]
MRKYVLYFAMSLFLFIGCKKDAVDGTSMQAFQSSINDMASSLNTLQQIKFSEALYILKTFGVDAEGDIQELNALAKLLEGKKVPEIFAMADAVAAENGIDWTSTGPPSLGEMNIFGNVAAMESDPNDIVADGLSITTRPVDVDTILGPKALQVIPRLVDNAGKNIDFSGAALETIMEVYSSGNLVSSSKNLMQNNNFTGFTIRFPNLPSDKINDGRIDITVTVKTTGKTYKMTKVGVPVNQKAMTQPSQPVIVQDSLSQEPSENMDPLTNGTLPAADPKNTVQKFLNNLSSQNLRAAFDVSDNPNWGSYEKFSNPTSGFGSVKSLSVKNITSASTTDTNASVNATYDVTDKSGNTSAVNVTFGLKNVNGEWKISNYKIN